MASNRFRKKPVVIEAVQFTGADVAGLCRCRLYGMPGRERELLDRGPHVHTIHGGQPVFVEPGDWILPEPDGRHFYPVQPAIFAAAYESADVPTAPPPALPSMQPKTREQLERARGIVSAWKFLPLWTPPESLALVDLADCLAAHEQELERTKDVARGFADRLYEAGRQIEALAVHAAPLPESVRVARRTLEQAATRFELLAGRFRSCHEEFGRHELSVEEATAFARETSLAVAVILTRLDAREREHTEDGGL